MMRTLECVKCDEAERFDSWPEDSDEYLDQVIRAEGWTFDGLDEICPQCSEPDDE